MKLFFSWPDNSFHIYFGRRSKIKRLTCYKTYNCQFYLGLRFVGSNLRPVFRFPRVLKRDNGLGSDLMNDLSTPQDSDDLANFRFRMGETPDNFRFRISDKRSDKDR